MNNAKKLIAIVDNEKESFRRIKEVLLEDLRMSNEFDVKFFEISIKKDIDGCINQLKKYKQLLEVIMIDIVLFETESEDKYLEVIPILRRIREEFPNIPVFFITRHIDAKYLPLITWCSLEDIDGIIFKQYLYADKDFMEIVKLTKSDFKNIIKKGKEKRNKYIISSIISIPEDEEKKNYKEIENFLHPDRRATLKIKNNIGSTVFRHLIEDLFKEQVLAPDRVIVSYFRPGFSGSYMFKIDIYKEEGTESWLMKISESKKIEREFNNYRKVKEKLNMGDYAEPTGRFAVYGNWGAFGNKMQSDMITLFDYIHSEIYNDNKENAINHLSNILKQLYKNKINEPMRLWKEHYKFTTKIYDRLLSFFEDIEKNKALYRGLPENIKEIEGFVHFRGESIKRIFESAYKVNLGVIHGDLNARNVLLNPKNNHVILIDYANKDDKGHLTRDIAKLEVDLIFSVLHGSSPKFYDWNSLSAWESLLSLVNIKNIFDDGLKITSDDKEVERICNFTVSLRKVLKENLYPDVKAGEYLISLLYYSFHYLVYPDISIQKKIFGMKWISRIITQLKE